MRCIFDDRDPERVEHLDQSPDLDRVSGHVHDDDGARLRSHGSERSIGRDVERSSVNVNKDRPSLEVGNDLGACGKGPCRAR